MNPSTVFLSRVSYPLSALITINLRMTLLRRKILFPAIVALIPLFPVLFWRLIVAIYGFPPSKSGGDPFNIYTLCSASMFMQFVVPLLSLLRGLSVMSEEVDEGTLIFLRLRPIPRTVIVLGKFMAYVLSVVILTGISLTAVYLILGSMPGADMILSEYRVLLRDMRIFALGLASYGAVMMLVGIFFKHSLKVGAFLLFVWDAFAAYIPGTAHKLTIKHYLQSIFPRQDFASGGGNDVKEIMIALLSEHKPSSATVSIVTLLGIIAASIVLTVLALKYKEFKGGQQETG
ncbi:MAG: ABC transporter permease [Candidatus Omnitrophota bacterium]